MSRTDAHVPMYLRAARGEVVRYAVHACGGSNCPLGDEGARVVGSCYWDYLFEGRNWCSCWMCHWHRRPEYRRAVDRAWLRDVARAWNGGDMDAGDEV